MKKYELTPPGRLGGYRTSWRSLRSQRRQGRISITISVRAARGRAKERYGSLPISSNARTALGTIGSVKCLGRVLITCLCRWQSCTVRSHNYSLMSPATRDRCGKWKRLPNLSLRFANDQRAIVDYPANVDITTSR